MDMGMVNARFLTCRIRRYCHERAQEILGKSPMAIKMPICNESTDDGMVGQQGI
jgi:naphthoate synthase